MAPYPPKEEDVARSLARATYEIAIGEVQNPWVAVDLQLCRDQPNMVRATCEECGKQVVFTPRLDARCLECNAIVPIETSFELQVYLTDGTRRIQATIQSPDVEEIMPYNSEEILAESQRGYPVRGLIASALRIQPVLCCIAPYKRMTSQNVLETAFTVLRVYPYATVFHRAQLPTGRPRIECMDQNWPAT